MPLEAGFTIGRTEVLVGESPPCVLVLRNNGDAALSIPPPVAGAGLPLYRIVEVRTGAQRTIASWTHASVVPKPIILEPGETRRVEMRLLPDVRINQPGQYEVSVIYPYNGMRDRAESQPVRLTILPIALRNLALDSVQGVGIAAVALNVSSDPPGVVIIRLDLSRGGGVGPIERIGSAPFSAQPIISIPPNTLAASGEWVVWIDGAKLEFIHWDADRDSPAPGSIKLPSASARVVPPIVAEPSPEPRSPGSVLLYVEDASGAALQLVELSATGTAARARLGARMPFPAPAPAWMMNFVRSDGTRLVTFAKSSGGRTTVHTSAWPGQVLATTRPQEVWSCPGDLVAAGATIGLDDVIRGAVLVWVGTDPVTRTLQVIGWTLDTKGSVVEHHRHTLVWPGTAPLGHATVRVRLSGEPAVLIGTVDQSWTLYDGFGVQQDVPAPFTETRLPIDVAFFELGDPAFVLGHPLDGLVIKLRDGQDIPPRVK